MKTLPEFKQAVSDLLEQEPIPASKLNKLIKELNEFIFSEEYKRLSMAEKGEAGDLLESLKSKSSSNTGTKASSSANPGGKATPPQDPDPDAAMPKNTPHPPVEMPEHDPRVEELMDQAEECFYSGRYAEAIRLYEQVLKLEPDRERAKEHLEQAKKYLESGDVPTVALPPDAAINYGKAQSAVRIGRYRDAKKLFEQAKEAIRGSGLMRWKEGQEFEVQLDIFIQAEDVAEEAVQLFNQGDVDEAIRELDNVYKETAIPRYKDLADRYRGFKTFQQQITDIFFSAGTAEPGILIQAAQDLEKLKSEFGGNPALQTLSKRFELIKPALTASLRDEIRALKVQSDRAENLEDARRYALEAKSHVDLAMKLGLDDRIFNQVQQWLRDIDKYIQALEDAKTSLKNNRAWPRQAWETSIEVRKHFPNDRDVASLRSDLAFYQYANWAIRLGLIVVVLFICIGFVFLGLQGFRAYTLSLTPTITPTFTPTLTPVPTDTPTPLPPTATPLPTSTPLPTTGRVLRTVWARNGCYENFTAIARIPEGNQVKVLPAIGERRFDPFDRECILVEYDGADTSVIGWILIQDFAP